MSYPWNDPRMTGAAPAISNMQTITVTSAPPIDWQARATAFEAENATLRDALKIAIVLVAAEMPHAPMLPHLRQALKETNNG